MIYYMVELWRLVLYQLRLSLLLLVSILLICPPKRVIYHCNITALIQTKWCGLSNIYQPLSLPSLSHPATQSSSPAASFSKYFISNISHFRLQHSPSWRSRVQVRVRLNMIKYCLWQPVWFVFVKIDK